MTCPYRDYTVGTPPSQEACESKRTQPVTRHENGRVPICPGCRDRARARARQGPMAYPRRKPWISHRTRGVSYAAIQWNVSCLFLFQSRRDDPKPAQGKRGGAAAKRRPGLCSANMIGRGGRYPFVRTPPRPKQSAVCFGLGTPPSCCRAFGSTDESNSLPNPGRHQCSCYSHWLALG